MDRDAIAAEYFASSDERLIELARGYDGLTAAAQDVLRAEFARRGLQPPLIEDEDPKPGHRLVTVQRFRDLTEALVVKSMLEGAGLLCFLQDENLVRMDWAYSNVIGGMRLQVPDDQVELALELLAASSNDGADAEVGGEKQGTLSAVWIAFDHIPADWAWFRAGESVPVQRAFTARKAGVAVRAVWRPMDRLRGRLAVRARRWFAAWPWA